MKEKKLCPYCGEEIMAVARKCKHCGKWLDKKDEHVVLTIEPQRVPKKEGGIKKWHIAVFIIILAVFVGVYFVMSNHQSEPDKEAVTVKTDPIINFAEPEEDEDGTLYQKKSDEQPMPKVERQEENIQGLNNENLFVNNYSSEEFLSLGESYEKGIGVEENHETAFCYYQKAAETGDPAALNKLGNMYAQGKGCTKNVSRAASCYLAAAEKGNKYAQHNVAWCYWDGVGIEKDQNAAIMWMRRSAAQGFEKAIQALKTMEVE
ncbi:MAG: sel1 repeat family protein [Bacteroidaceae bacterium]|nr:sel1 repeat family protein [Bacteroidaceae bacterium]